MIHAELKLRIPRDHCVVILPNLSVPDNVGDYINGLDNLMTVEQSFRPLEALRIGDIVEDCELVDKGTGDRFNLPPGVGYRVQGLEIEPIAASRPMRTYTLVRVK